MTEPRTVTATFVEANIVFTTSKTYLPWALGGLAGADAKCQERATVAGLPGKYVAWLSTANPHVAAASRLGAARGWIRPDGRPFADLVSSLIKNGQVFFPPRIDEFGHDLDSVQVATGTAAGGDVAAYLVGDGGTAPYTAGDWNGPPSAPYAMGDSSAGTEGWTARTVGSSEAHLYCFGVDLTSAVTPQAKGRRAFEAFNFGLDGGIQAADAYCASRALGNALGGTYRAFLATSGASAASRFDAGGDPWVRTDGVSIVGKAVELFDAILLAPIDVGPDGRTYYGGYVWTGAAAPTVVGTETCSDWKPAADAGSTYGDVGNASSTTQTFFNGGGYPCNSAPGLYCLQE